tara:strand:- start:2166 stop:3329 length:1164 start_codon:yes stop_codon:yes gene_type:complete
MKFSVLKSDLLRELQLFQGVVERKNTIPILANLLIEAEDGVDTVRLAATDLEVALLSRCDAKVNQGGAVTLPAKKLNDIVRALPETQIEFSQPTDGTVNVVADRFSSRIQALPREDFPSLPEGTGESVTRLSSEALGEMVSKTQFAITGEDTRYFLNGALFLISDSQMTLVATDGHRLALVTSGRGNGDELEEGAEGHDEARVILPKKTLWELARLVDPRNGLLGDEKTDVLYEQGENHLFFDVNGRQLVSRMVDAQFPAHERVIPQGNNKRVEFERDRLAKAIKRVALLSTERSRAVKFKIDANKVEVSSSSPEVGEASEELSVDYKGAEVAICFNAQYVLDFLNVVDSESVLLEFKDELSQAVLSPVSDDSYDYNYTYVIMPMRV